jgi:hypothetical protein
MKCGGLYDNTAHPLKDTGILTKSSWAGYMFKFVIRFISVSKSCHPRRYLYSAQNGVPNRKVKVCAVLSRGKARDYSAKDLK